MRFMFLPLLFAPLAFAADDRPVKVTQVIEYADGRKVVIEESVAPKVKRAAILVEEPPTVIRVRSTSPATVYVDEPAPVVIRRAALPVLYSVSPPPVLYAAPPALLVPKKQYSTPVRDFFFGR